MAIKVKQGFEAVVIGFNNSSKPLGQRNDLYILLEHAKSHNIVRILNMFEEALEEVIDDLKAEAFESKRRFKKSRTAHGRTDRNNTTAAEAG